MPQLTVYIATLSMHSIGNLLPASDLRGSKDARDSWVSGGLKMLVSRTSQTGQTGQTAQTEENSHTYLLIGVASVNINPSSEARCE